MGVILASYWPNWEPIFLNLWPQAMWEFQPMAPGHQWGRCWGCWRGALFGFLTMCFFSRNLRNWLNKQLVLGGGWPKTMIQYMNTICKNTTQNHSCKGTIHHVPRILAYSFGYVVSPFTPCRVLLKTHPMLSYRKRFFPRMPPRIFQDFLGKGRAVVSFHGALACPKEKLLDDVTSDRPWESMRIGTKWGTRWTFVKRLPLIGFHINNYIYEAKGVSFSYCWWFRHSARKPPGMVKKPL